MSTTPVNKLKLTLSNLAPERVLLWFVLALYFLLSGYKALRLGHFGDGVIYNTIARNMAEGWGSFWAPYFSDEIFPIFYEHPPLILYLKSLAFRLFGDGVYFEGLYGIFIGFVLLFVTAMLWRLSCVSSTSKTGTWWVLLLVISLPYFSYAVDSGLTVVTFSALFLASIYFAHQAMFCEKQLISFISALIAAIFIYLGILSAGPVALATFALPLIAWLVFKGSFSLMIKITLLMVITVTFLLTLTLWLFPESLAFWESFLTKQSLASLTGERTNSPTHIKLPKHVMQEMIVPAVLIGILMLCLRFKKVVKNNRQSVYFVLLFIASTFPFFLSSRQNYHYIFHAWFLAMLALAHFSIPLAKRAQKALADKNWLKGVYLLLAVVIVGSAFYLMFERKDHLSRRQDFYADFYLQNIHIPERTQVNVCPYEQMISSGERSTRIFPTLQRVYKASIVITPGAPFLIIAKNMGCVIPDGYRLVHTQPTRRYLLYQKVATQ